MAAFVIAWLTADELQLVHEIAGYVVAALVAFWLVWGFVGSRYAKSCAAPLPLSPMWAIWRVDGNAPSEVEEMLEYLPRILRT